MSKKLLQAALKSFGDNKTALAEHLGVKRQHIQNWLRSDYGPPSWHIEAVAKAAKARK